MFILADDLSGAADCGVACTGAGLETLVALGHSAGDSSADVLSLDADTRRMTADEAAREVGRVIRSYAANHNLHLFKKIDSTLRGNLGPELAAALNAICDTREHVQRSVAIMAPAFPAIGRTTKDGTQYAHGQPLHDLDIWRIQGISGSAFIPGLLMSAGLQCAVIGLGTIRASQSALIDEMNAAAQQADVLVCDAETDGDLFAIATASAQLTCRPLWVGSAGLAFQLPRALGIAKDVSAAPVSLSPVALPLLFVIGSLSHNSLQQVRLLSSMSGTAAICVPLDLLLAGEEHADWCEYSHRLQQAIQSGSDVILSPSTEPRVDLDRRPYIAAGLARMAASAASGIGALVASGGETARAVFNELGIVRLRLLGELEKGIPLSVTENWSRALPVITKAGDFGGTDALLKCARFLHHNSSPHISPHSTGKVVQ